MVSSLAPMGGLLMYLMSSCVRLRKMSVFAARSNANQNRCLLLVIRHGIVLCPPLALPWPPLAPPWLAFGFRWLPLGRPLVALSVSFCLSLSLSVFPYFSSSDPLPPCFRDSRLPYAASWPLNGRRAKAPLPSQDSV